MHLLHTTTIHTTTRFSECRSTPVAWSFIARSFYPRPIHDQKRQRKGCSNDRVVRAPSRLSLRQARRPCNSGGYCSGAYSSSASSSLHHSWQGPTLHEVSGTCGRKGGLCLNKQTAHARRSHPKGEETPIINHTASRLDRREPMETHGVTPGKCARAQIWWLKCVP